LIGGGVYAWQHHNDDEFTGKGALIGAGAGLMMPAAGAGAAGFLGLEGGAATAASIGVNAAFGAGYTYAVNSALCVPTTPTDLFVGAIGGGLAGAGIAAGAARGGLGSSAVTSGTARSSGGRLPASAELPARRFPIRDSDPQDPIPTGSWVTSGRQLQNGDYHYVVMPDGTVRAINTERMFDLAEYSGHTSLAERGEVLMAGRFTVRDGTIVKLDNGSGHYWPRDSRAGYRPIESVAREALARNGFPGATNAVWDPWPLRRS
jgi:hypothetical protein